MNIPRLNPDAIGDSNMEIGIARDPQAKFRHTAEMQQQFFDIPTERLHCGITVAVVDKPNDAEHKQLQIVCCGTEEDQGKMLALLIRHIDEAMKRQRN